MGNSITKSTKNKEEEEAAVAVEGTSQSSSNNSTTTNSNQIRFSTSLLSLSTFASKFSRTSSSDVTTSASKPVKSHSFSAVHRTSNENLSSTKHQRLRWSGAIFTRKTPNFISRSQYHLRNFSRSLPHIAVPRFLSKSSTKLSASELAAQSKTIWPTPTIVLLFSPQFKLVSREYLQQLYAFDGVVARGAFGVVFRVIDRDEHKQYALKVLNKSQIIRDNAVRQLKNEVDIQTICGHNSFIVKCIAFWQSHREIYLLSEYISGGELFGYITKFSHKLVQLYVAEIALALDFLHNAGVIYRDLKPENILLDDNLHIKLIDFGLSKWLKIGQRTNTICGTLQYMAPEIFNGEQYGHAVDWYALGVIACRMLTDQYPDIVRPKMITSKSYPMEIIDEVDDANAAMFENAALPTSITSPNILSECSDDTKTGSIKLPHEAESLPNDCKDLLNRLLEFKPDHRIRSLFSLQRIAFYKGYNFDDVKKQKINPRDLMDSTEIY